MAVPRSAASGEGSDVALVLCTESGGEADERWAIVERWTWWSDAAAACCPSARNARSRSSGIGFAAVMRRP